MKYIVNNFFICTCILNIFKFYRNIVFLVVVMYKVLKLLWKYICNLRKYLYFWNIYIYVRKFFKECGIYIVLEIVLVFVKI